MPTYQANAVVLRRLEYGEADRILTLLTREYGKLGAIAKGARRGKARAGSSLPPTWIGLEPSTSWDWRWMRNCAATATGRGTLTATALAATP